MTSAEAGSGIELRALTKQYRGARAPAVDAASIHIAPGEFMTFLGPSGSGKTTTLNMIAGFVDVTSGEILLDGQDISVLPPHRRNLGMVFQHYALFPHMTVTENIAFPLRQRRVSRDDIARRVQQALGLVHLEDYGDRYPRQLSGGQQQRVALARAVVFSPRALLLDEPLGALDRKLRQSLQNEVRRMHRELGLTFVFVTHDQEEALSLSDRIAVFRDGHIEQVGTPDELYHRPSTLFVAQFLGESNVFHGALDRSASGYRCGDLVWQVEDAPAAAGDGVLMVRPERVLVQARDHTVPAGVNSTHAVVTADVFLGTHHKVELEFPGGGQGSAIVPVGLARPYRAGDSVLVSWRPADQRIVRSGPEAAPTADGPTADTRVSARVNS